MLKNYFKITLRNLKKHKGYSAIASLILFVACINYMNLATARSINRSKEVGLRKTLGSKRTQLIIQFYGESLFFSLIVIIIALPTVDFTLPLMNQLTGKALSIGKLFNLQGYFFLFVSVLFTALLAGSYPALFLSRFNPAAVIKGQTTTGSKNVTMRKMLVILQFSVTIFLIIAAIIITQQLDYFKNSKLWADNELFITMPLRGNDVSKNYESFKNEILQDSRITHAAASSHIPFTENKLGLYRFPEISGSNSSFASDYFVVDYDFQNLFDLEFVSGRDFTRVPVKNEKAVEYILNESAVKALGVTNEQILGTYINDIYWDNSGTVVGVVKDFNYNSLYNQIGPLVIKMHQFYVRFLTIKIASNNIPNSLEFLEKKWQKFFPSSPFVYSFLDNELQNLYTAEDKVSKLFNSFGIIAILISCLGLFGLSAFAAEQRTKEIGVRKILGASSISIITLLSREFLKLIALGNLISWPIAWFIMNKWLQNFAYKIDISYLTMDS